MTSKLLFLVALGYVIGNPTWSEVGVVLTAIPLGLCLVVEIRRLSR